MQLSLSSTPLPSRLYELRSIIEPIDLAELFPLPQPLEVELGSGDGSFLAEYARRHPERNFIGIERLLGRLRKLDRKARRAGLANLRAIRIESSYFLRHLLPPGSTTALHIYFPDPWPKRKHHRHRLINEGFPSIACRALAPGGAVFLRTDHPDYLDQIDFVFGQCDAFVPIETPGERLVVLTDFERAFQAQGVKTMHAGFALRA